MKNPYRVEYFDRVGTLKTTPQWHLHHPNGKYDVFFDDIKAETACYQLNLAFHLGVVEGIEMSAKESISHETHQARVIAASIRALKAVTA